MQKGFSTLYIVIMLGSIALGLLLAISTTNVWSILESTDSKRGAQARGLVNACAEVALESLRESEYSVGTGSFSIDSNSCTYVITNTGSTTRSISVTGSVGPVTRKVLITTSTFNPITISSWKEVP